MSESLTRTDVRRNMQSLQLQLCSAVTLLKAEKATAQRKGCAQIFYGRQCTCLAAIIKENASLHSASNDLLVYAKCNF